MWSSKPLFHCAGLGWLVLALLFSGCGTPRLSAERPARSFAFSHDAFDFPNELAWRYEFDAEGRRVSTRRAEPRPEYTLHCFVLARAARQFFAHARFEPGGPRLGEREYRQRVRAVMRRSARGASPPGERVIIPGYAGLREFSAAHEAMLKRECGGAWRSYFQRGHWRMVFPFSHRHQEATAAQLRRALAAAWPPLVHVVRFPALTINHALLVIGAEESPEAIRFLAYDPNSPDAPIKLRFDRGTRRFFLSRSDYFAGGRVDVYEIFVDACHRTGASGREASAP